MALLLLVILFFLSGACALVFSNHSSQGAYEKRREDPRFRALFDWNLDIMRQNYVAGPGDLSQWVGDGPILTDDKPLIE